jgi:hypothetical protein
MVVFAKHSYCQNIVGFTTREIVGIIDAVA